MSSRGICKMQIVTVHVFSTSSHPAFCKLWSHYLRDFVFGFFPEEQCDALPYLAFGSPLATEHVAAACSCRTWWLKGLLPSCCFLSFSFFFFLLLLLLHVPCVTVDFSVSPSLRFPPLFFPWPLPQLWKWTLCYGYEGENEVCSKFPTLLARQPLGSLPTFCKSSLANQDSCRQSPDPEFPDKEMFMLSFFKRSLLPREWGWKKLKPHTGLWGLRAGVYGYVHCIVCLITLGDSVHVWLASL